MLLIPFWVVTYRIFVATSGLQLNILAIVASMTISFRPVEEMALQ